MAVTVGAREVQHDLGFTGAGIGVAVIDSGVTAWHDDLTYQGSSTLVQTRGRPARRRRSSTSSAARRRRTTTTGTARTWPASSPATATTRAARAPGIAPDAHLVSLKVLDRNRPRRHQQRHRRARLRGREQGALQHPRHQPVGRRRGHRVLQDGSADARGQARRRRRHRRRDGGRQPREELARADAVRRASPRPAMRPWVLTVGASSHQGTVNRTTT